MANPKTKSERAAARAAARKSAEAKAQAARAAADRAAAAKAAVYVPVGAVPGNAQTAETKAATVAAITEGKARARRVEAAAKAAAAAANKAKAKADGLQVFVPSVKLTVAGNVEDLRGVPSVRVRAPNPKPASADRPPLVQPKPKKVKPAEVHPVYAAAAAAVNARKPTGATRKQW